ncbi:MAG: hypothetical protein ACKPBV_11095 [Sphaerospermopsis kisseleviana]
MDKLSFVEKLSHQSQQSVQELIRIITHSKNQFVLVIAHCNYTDLQERVIQDLKTKLELDVNIQELHLAPSTESLYQAIKREAQLLELKLGKDKSFALMVSGLRLVSDLDNVLNATNHIREEFRNFSFPVVLWIDDEILTKLIRSVPDFYSWATTIKFDKTSDELKTFIQQTADKVFNKLNEGYENELLDLLHNFFMLQ